MKRIIETISAGFEVIVKRFWVLLVPILLDLFLWFGPRLSLAPLIHSGLNALAEFTAQAGNEQMAAMQQMWKEMGLLEAWELIASRFNLFSILSSVNVLSLLSLGMLDLPSVMATINLDKAPVAYNAWVIEIQNGFGFVGLALLLLATGLLLIIAYQGLIAQEVREETISPRYLARRLGRYWLSAMMVALALLAVLALVGGPVIAILLVVGALSPILMQLGFLIGSAVLFWLGLFILFVPQGILLNEEPPFKAMLTSVQLVRGNLWSVLLLLLLTRVIRFGFSLLWPMLTGTTVGMAIAILGNAFVGAGLAAASFIFYRDRFTAWRERMNEVAQA